MPWVVPTGRVASNPKEPCFQFIIEVQMHFRSTDQQVGLLIGVLLDIAGKFCADSVVEDSKALVVVVGQLNSEHIRYHGPISVHDGSSVVHFAL